ncbi:hypothetical protein MMC14_009980 [Varicellaria rhodocarpa]|nr:hypothetical protein [Varicellaria rhodocarpa]
MAIEAANQIAENRPIMGFEFKDVVFYAALKLSKDDDGVETRLSLRPLRDPLEKDMTWNDFRLYVCKNDTWEEICRGFIRADYEEVQPDVDGGLELRESLRHAREIHAAARGTCNNSVEPDAMYKHLQTCGFQYGPAFRPLNRLFHNNRGEAIADISIFDGSIGQDTQATQSHIIHPTTLDGVFQLAFVALTQGGSLSMPTMVPNHIKKLWVSSSGVGSSNTEPIHAFTEAKKIGYRKIVSSGVVLNKAEDSVKLQIDGFEAIMVATAQTASDTLQGPRHLYYHIDWKPDPALLDNSQVKEYCNYKTSHKSKVDRKDFYRDADFIFLAFIYNAINDLSSSDPQSFKISFQKYIAWMQMQLYRFNMGLLPGSNPDWKHLLHDSAYIDTVCKRLPATNKLGEYYVKVGRKPTQVLRGEVEPLQVLYGDEQLIKDFYEEGNKSSQGFEVFGRYLDTLVHKDPGMKILEIGAGTGTTTELLHETLMYKDK